jgi:hypothetical protein
MADRFSDANDLLHSPASSAQAVTPSATEDLPFISRAIYVGGAGNLSVIMKNRQTVTFTAVPAGTVLPIRVLRVLATSTATSITALW